MGGVSVSEGCMFVPEGSSSGTALVFPVKPDHFVDAMCIDWNIKSEYTMMHRMIGFTANNKSCVR